MEHVDRVVIELNNYGKTVVQEIARRCSTEYAQLGVRVYVEYQDARRIDGTAPIEPR